MSGNARSAAPALAVALLMLLALAAMPAVAQEEEEAAAAVESGASEIPKGATFNYRSHGYADPFLGPQSRSPVDVGIRPPGIRGMRVEEVSIKGIFDTPEGPVAMFLGSDGDYYSLGVGDRLYDGYMIEIDQKSGTVWFRQENPDPTSLRPFRDVPKSLYPEQEVTP